MQRQMILHRTTDFIMSVLMVLLMAYQIAGDALHEYLGIAMTIAVVFHNILNRRWYASLFEGRYSVFRTLLLIINAGVVISFALTAFSGMVLANSTTTFMNGLMRTSTAMILHLGMSYWSMVFISLHLGFHWAAVTAKLKARGNRTVWNCMTICAFGLSVYGAWLYIRNGISSYLLFQTHFAMYDFGQTPAAVIFEIISMCALGILIAHVLSKAVRKPAGS
jgi:hypothetical protein